MYRRDLVEGALAYYTAQLDRIQKSNSRPPADNYLDEGDYPRFIAAARQQIRELSARFGERCPFCDQDPDEGVPCTCADK